MINQNGARFERAKSFISRFTTEDVRGSLYTCPKNCRARVVLLFVTNASSIVGGGGDNTNITVEWYRAEEDLHYFILGSRNLSSTEFLQFSEGYIVLEPGDKIEITPSNNASPQISAFCTVEEIFVPVG